MEIFFPFGKGGFCIYFFGFWILFFLFGGCCCQTNSSTQSKTGFALFPPSLSVGKSAPGAPNRANGRCCEAQLCQSNLWENEDNKTIWDENVLLISSFSFLLLGQVAKRTNSGFQIDSFVHRMRRCSNCGQMAFGQCGRFA